jgi:hypothetical protein
MQTIASNASRGRRTAISGFVALMLVAGLLMLPSARAAADAFLQSFRAQSIVFVPVDASRLEQLAQTKLDPSTLFLSMPRVVGTPTTSHVASASEAAGLTGFQPLQPATLPGPTTSTEITVHGDMDVQAQVNVKTVRDLLAALSITGVNLPDALGDAPISAHVPAFVQSRYAGADYSMILVQGTTPTVNLPKGVDLAQLGKAGLLLLGMKPDQADAMSKQIDWSSTLVVPFPENMSNVLRVQVGSSQGMLVTAEPSPNEINAGGTHAVLYWQNGDRFYVLEGSGANMNPDTMLLVARSVK